MQQRACELASWLTHMPTILGHKLPHSLPHSWGKGSILVPFNGVTFEPSMPACYSSFPYVSCMAYQMPSVMWGSV